MKFSKSVVTTGLAATLAAAMVIGGGTFAYLKGVSDDVTNTFNTNKVLVDLKETTGSEYDIIPGTTQKKDPTVILNNTADAYVYVVVTDKTAGLVDYAIADGWAPLDGRANVYYREAAGSAAEQSFPVLKNNTVSYDAALENSDMLDAEGSLKQGVVLSFTARAIQKAGFANAADAYDGLPAMATTGKEFTDALAKAQDGDVIELKNDIVLDTAASIKTDVTVKGDGNTVVSKSPIYVSDSANVTFDTVTFTKPDNASDNATSVYASSLDSKLVFEGCSFVDFQWEGIQITPLAGAEIVVNNCYFKNSKTMAENGFETKRYLHIEVTDYDTDISNIKATITNNTFENVVQSAKGGNGYFSDSAVTVCGVPLTNLTCEGNVFTGKVQKNALSSSSILWIQNGNTQIPASYAGFSIDPSAQLVD